MTSTVYRDPHGTSTVKFGAAVYRGCREYRPSLVWRPIFDCLGLGLEVSGLVNIPGIRPPHFQFVSYAYEFTMSVNCDIDVLVWQNIFQS